ncbi:MAG: plasmid pRiA4b ORF-3 family protein [Solirubrobacterales bacterium]|nr:plasmid pRiA4b ORF-3 family protein [Solirubrobacterales bacterium]
MQQSYVFDVELVGFGDVRRVVAVREDLTLVDLHYALQSAFGWDDDHLYAFWLEDRFWTNASEHFTRPCVSDETDARAGRSAAIRLDRLGLEQGRRIAYVFDFGDEWRVRLQLREVIADDDHRSPRLLESVGTAPPQYSQVA